MEPRRIDRQPIHVQAERASRLAGMGPSEEMLEEGMRFALAEIERCSGNDVNAAKGNTAYTKLMRFLREQLIPKGWSRGGQPDLESVISPDRGFQIVTSSANWATGLADRMPSTKYAKGRVTAETIKNHGQLALDVIGLTREAKAELMTFFWLYYLDSQKEEIRHELAVPTHMTIRPNAKRGRIDQFGSRVILNAIQMDSSAEMEEESDHEEEFSDDLDIQVPRRSE